MIKPKILKFHLSISILAGILSLVYLFLIPLDQSRGRLVNYSLLRGGIAFVIIVLVTLFSYLLVFASRQPEQAQSACDWLNRKLTPPQGCLFRFQFWLAIGMIFTVEAVLLTYFSLPVPMRPLLVWGAFIGISTWVSLRIGFRGVYRERPSLADHIRLGWRSWSRNQQRVFTALAVMGLIYFIIFIPINNGGRIHPDEDIIYPDVANMLLTYDTFAETLRNTFVIDTWWYGYPYFPISALPLIIPRLIYGNAFADNIQLNMLLLRQFISVLPMILSIILLVYLVDEFKSAWLSVGMFVVLTLVPGVVRYNTRFWHPDSIIVLLVLLTFFFLKRDKLRYGVNFFLAAFTIGLATAIKVWGLFFFLAIGGYLLAGMVEKKISTRKMIVLGLLFIIVMVGSFLITTPSILIPWNFNTYVSLMQDYYPTMRFGYDEPDPQGVYRTGLPAWMVFFRIHFMQDFFFCFSVFAGLIGSLLGKQKTLNRLIMAWCVVVGVYLVGWIAVKSFQYMLPMMVPLYACAFMFPQVAGAPPYPAKLSFLAHPRAKAVLWVITLMMLALQFSFNVKLIPLSIRF